MKKEHTIWNEKYRSDKLENYLCDGEIRSKIQEYIDKQDIPMIGLFGTPGSGKTTLAKLLVNNIDCDYLYLNATEHRGMDDIKEKVGSFASAGSFKPLKIVILDESTHILQASQVLLLNMMETHSLTTRFILTGNYPERLIPPLRSRLQEFKLVPPTKKLVAKHLDSILGKEEVEYEINDLVTIINKYYPDFRKIINYCQKNTIDNRLILPKNISGNEDYQNQILEILKKPFSKSFNEIRQILANNDISSFEELYRFLYEETGKYGVGCEGQLAVIINEHQYQNNFVVDKEICFMACISKLIETLKQNKLLK